MNNKNYITIAVVIALLFGSQAIASLTLNSTTVAGSGDVVVSSAATTVATYSVPTGNSLTSNFLNITGTLTPVSAVARGVNFQFTGGGSVASGINGLRIDLLAGYTGAGINAAAQFSNSSAGTGANAWGGAANQGTFNGASGATTGHNVGAANVVLNSSVLNIGSVSRASVATVGTNMGVVGIVSNGAINIGGYFGLTGTTAPSFASSSALIADNGATTSDIFVARDNGTPVFTVADGGATSLTGVLTAASGTAATAGGAPALKLGSSGTLGIYYGSGVPTISAAQGSLYMRTDGNSTSTRMYVNTDGGTTWTAVTTAL